MLSACLSLLLMSALPRVLGAGRCPSLEISGSLETLLAFPGASEMIPIAQDAFGCTVRLFFDGVLPSTPAAQACLLLWAHVRPVSCSSAVETGLHFRLVGVAGVHRTEEDDFSGYLFRPDESYQERLGFAYLPGICNHVVPALVQVYDVFEDFVLGLVVDRIVDDALDCVARGCHVCPEWVLLVLDLQLLEFDIALHPFFGRRAHGERVVKGVDTQLVLCASNGEIHIGTPADRLQEHAAVHWSQVQASSRSVNYLIIGHRKAR